MNIKSISIPEYATSEKSKLRVKQLAVDLKHDPEIRMAMLAGNNPAENHYLAKKNSKQNVAIIGPGSIFDPNHLGVDPSVSKVQFPKNKTGGIYGHFFHDLPAAVKELVMGRYIANKKLIQDMVF